MDVSEYFKRLQHKGPLPRGGQWNSGRKAKEQARAIYDFETYDWNPPEGEQQQEIHALCCGILLPNEEEIFIHDSSQKEPEALVDEVLTTMKRLIEEGRCTEFWAHNGARFDMLFLMEAAVERGWQVEAALAGVGVMGGTLFPDGSEGIRIPLCDSTKVLQSTLKDIAKNFGTAHQKSFEDYSIDMRTLPLAELKAGCLNDCHVLKEALDTVEGLFQEHGGRLRKTFSSSILTVMQRSLRDQGIKLPKHKSDTPYGNANAEIMKYFMGARVEVLHHMPHVLQKKYDVASSYPWSMTQRLPIKYEGEVLNEAARKAFEDPEQEGIFFATVDVPKMWLPPLPYRLEGGGIFFPVGRWHSAFPAAELRYARLLGVQVHVKRAFLFGAGFPLRKFVTDFYPIKQHGKGAKRQFGKLCLNGGFGKWGEKPLRERLIVARDEVEAMDISEELEGIRFIDEDSDRRYMAREYVRWAPHAHFALASYITAYSRILIHERMVEAKGLSYVDTDGIHCEDWQGEVGEELGQFKLELENFRCINAAPKIYAYFDPVTGVVLSDKEGKLYVACKGFPKADGNVWKQIVESAGTRYLAELNGVSKADAAAMAAADGVEHVAPRLLRSMLRTLLEGRSEGVVRERRVKTWSGRSMKRRPFPDGTTEPWHVRDLKAGRHLKAISPVVLEGAEE